MFPCSQQALYKEKSDLNFMKPHMQIYELTLAFFHGFQFVQCKFEFPTGRESMNMAVEYCGINCCSSIPKPHQPS